MNKKKLQARIRAEAERDLLAELAIQLHEEGYREDTLGLSPFDPAYNAVLNYIREWDRFGRILPNGLGKKIYERATPADHKRHK